MQTVGQPFNLKALIRLWQVKALDLKVKDIMIMFRYLLFGLNSPLSSILCNILKIFVFEPNFYVISTVMIPYSRGPSVENHWFSRVSARHSDRVRRKQKNVHFLQAPRTRHQNPKKILNLQNKMTATLYFFCFRTFNPDAKVKRCSFKQYVSAMQREHKKVWNHKKSSLKKVSGPVSAILDVQKIKSWKVVQIECVWFV